MKYEHIIDGEMRVNYFIDSLSKTSLSNLEMEKFPKEPKRGTIEFFLGHRLQKRKNAMRL